LPSGAKIGHRALRRYYKQNLKIPADEDERPSRRMITNEAYGVRNESDSQALLLMTHYEFKQAKTHHEIRHRQDFDTRIGIRANKLQRHFRAQVLF